MKAQIKEISVGTPLNSLHCKSTSAIGRHHRNHHHQTTAAELAAAAAAAVAVTPSSNEEMQIYFSKLKELVPFMPRNRKLSKLEIIQYVIDYICDLQLALEPPQSSLCGQTALSLASSPSVVHRQPLGVINTSNGPNNTCAVQESTSSSSRHPLPHEKSPIVDNPCVSS